MFTGICCFLLLASYVIEVCVVLLEPMRLSLFENAYVFFTKALLMWRQSIKKNINPLSFLENGYIVVDFSGAVGSTTSGLYFFWTICLFGL